MKYNINIIFFIVNPLILDINDEINGDTNIDNNAPAPETTPISAFVRPLYCKNIAI